VTMAGAWLQAAVKLPSATAGEARALLEAVRDAEIWRPVQNTPRCFNVVQSTIRRCGASAGVGVVDLPVRFEEHTRALPDRRLFLDYCHLTSEGIGLAMASTAELLLPHLANGVPRTWSELASTVQSPGGEIEGDARLLSAIHCAKLGQRFQFVRYHCAEAVKASPRLVDALRCCLDFQSRRTPNVLCASFGELIRTSTPSAARYLLTHGLESKESHKALRRAFVNAALSVVDPMDPSTGERTRALINSVHGLKLEPVSLLQQAYSEEGVCSESQSADYHISTQLESKFVVYCKAPSTVDIEITCRVPYKGTEIAITMNGHGIGAIPATTQWTTQRLTASAGTGENTLTIRWPLRTDVGKDGFARIRDSLETGSAPAFSPVLGEIHSLFASLQAE